SGARCARCDLQPGDKWHPRGRLDLLRSRIGDRGGRVVHRWLGFGPPCSCEGVGTHRIRSASAARELMVSTELLMAVIAGVLIIVLANALSKWIGVAGPLILVAIGLGVSLIPAVSAISIPPEIILVGVLPP